MAVTTLRPAFGSGEDWNRGHWRSRRRSWRCARPSGRVRIGTLSLCLSSLIPESLRPAFGSGEDWNLRADPHPRKSLAMLRPAFGSGEDWNSYRGPTPPPITPLRPAFGSGEDWNKEWICRGNGRYLVAPGLRVGRGLEPEHRLDTELAGVSCARPSGRARIEARWPCGRGFLGNAIGGRARSDRTLLAFTQHPRSARGRRRRWRRCRRRSGGASPPRWGAGARRPRGSPSSGGPTDPGLMSSAAPRELVATRRNCRYVCPDRSRISETLESSSASSAAGSG